MGRSGRGLGLDVPHPQHAAHRSGLLVAGASTAGPRARRAGKTALSAACSPRPCRPQRRVTARPAGSTTSSASTAQPEIQPAENLAIASLADQAVAPAPRLSSTRRSSRRAPRPRRSEKAARIRPQGAERARAGYPASARWKRSRWRIGKTGGDVLAIRRLRPPPSMPTARGRRGFGRDPGIGPDTGFARRPGRARIPTGRPVAVCGWRPGSWPGRCLPRSSARA